MKPSVDLKQIKALAWLSAGIIVLTGIVFNAYPEWDLAISNAFYDKKTNFAYRGGTFLGELRHVFMRLYYLFYGFIIVAFVYCLYQNTRFLKLDAKGWWFQILCSLLGPGLLTNGILKEIWGRARPREIAEFGRTAEFTPVFWFSDQCASNCSFVSGEASAMFMIFAALALTAHRYRKRLLVLMLAAGGFVSLMRVGQGGHFATDCLVAGGLMMLVACAIYWVMYLRAPAKYLPSKVSSQT